MKILVADDSRVMRQIVVRTLRRAGYAEHTVLEVGDGLAAWEVVRVECPDLVLADWYMPGLSGLELLRRLRAAGHAVTFGLVTSGRSAELRERAHAAGAQFVIGKPFTADDFRAVLAPALPAEAPEEPEPPEEPVATSLPANKAVRDLFETLLGRDVTVAPCHPVEIGPDDPAYVAVYVDGSMRLSATAVADLPLAARCATALGLTPPSDADDALRERRLPDALRHNMDEVLNIVSTLFNLPGAPYVRLYATYPPGQTPPADVDTVVHTLGRRLDLVVDIAGYGEGRLGLVLAP